MKLLLSCQTRIGTFYVGLSPDGRYHPIFDDDSLGSYASVEQAVDDLVNNETFSLLNPRTLKLVDTSTLGLPEDWRVWKRMA